MNLRNMTPHRNRVKRWNCPQIMKRNNNERFYFDLCEMKTINTFHDQAISHLIKLQHINYNRIVNKVSSFQHQSYKNIYWKRVMFCTVSVNLSWWYLSNLVIRLSTWFHRLVNTSIYVKCYIDVTSIGNRKTIHQEISSSI